MKKPIVPYIVYAETTPNVDAMSYVTDKFLVKNDKSYEYLSIEETEACPLAKAIFKEFDFVTKVFITSNYLSISKSKEVGWDMYTMAVRSFIYEYLTQGREILKYDSATSTDEKREDDKQLKDVDFKNEENYTDIDKKIVAALEEYIDPAAGGDGGKIEFVNFKDGVVWVIMRGSCHNCRFSHSTLKMGVENVLMVEVPGVKKVKAVNA